MATGAQTLASAADVITIPRVLYDAMLESIELLTNRDELRGILKAFEDIDAGRIYSLKEFKKMCRTLK